MDQLEAKTSGDASKSQRKHILGTHRKTKPSQTRPKSYQAAAGGTHLRKGAAQFELHPPDRGSPAACHHTSEASCKVEGAPAGPRKASPSAAHSRSIIRQFHSSKVPEVALQQSLQPKQSLQGALSKSSQARKIIRTVVISANVKEVRVQACT